MSISINLNIHYSAPANVWEELKKHISQCQTGLGTTMDSHVGMVTKEGYFDLVLYMEHVA